jgi:hypothetical protein
MHSSFRKPWSLSSSIIQELTSQCKITVVCHHFIILDPVTGDTRSRRNFTTLRDVSKMDVSKMEHHGYTVDWIWPRRRGWLLSPDLPRRDTTRTNTHLEILENTKSSLPAYQATCIGHHRRRLWHAIELSVDPSRLNGRDRRWLAHAALVRHSTGDAVVGRPTSTNGRVIQYDFWKVVQFLKHVSKKVKINSKMGITYNYRDTEHGQLFEASHNHPNGSATRQLRCCQIWP